MRVLWPTGVCRRGRAASSGTRSRPASRTSCPNASSSGWIAGHGILRMADQPHSAARGRRGVVCYFRDISKSRPGARGAARGRQSQGRVSRHAGARASESAGAASQLAGGPEARRERAAERSPRRDHGPAVEPPRAARGRPDGGVAYHARRFELRREHGEPRSGASKRGRGQRAADPRRRTPPEHLDAGRSLMLDADPVRLAQIFGNLLNNAAKYSDKGGQIDVRRRGARATRPWSPSATRAMASSPNSCRSCSRCLREARSAQRNQTGLGSVSPWCGGWRKCTAAESRPKPGLGKGSRFTVRLPLNVRQVAAPKARRREHSSIASLSVLVVDDNRDAAESLAMLLSTAGAEVHVAHDGPTALAEFERASRTWCCSTSACPAWTATKWPAGCARSRAASASRSSR